MGSVWESLARSINDHDHLEMVVGTKARFGGCMGQTEDWDMTKGGSLALTLMNYEQTNFVSDGRGVTVPAFRNPKRFNFGNRLPRLLKQLVKLLIVLINSWTKKWDHTLTTEVDDTKIVPRMSWMMALHKT